MTLMRYSILFILTAFALLAGCKKDEEEDLQQESKTTVLSFEDKVREVYDYPISVKLPARGDLVVRHNLSTKQQQQSHF